MEAVQKKEVHDLAVAICNTLFTIALRFRQVLQETLQFNEQLIKEAEKTILSKEALKDRVVPMQPQSSNALQKAVQLQRKHCQFSSVISTGFHASPPPIAVVG